MNNWLDKFDEERDVFYKQGGLIKRADGHYSRRGLWDNIRANRGSGRKPTAAMLEQERKIKKHDEGSFVEGENPPVTFGNPYADYMRDWTNSPMGQQILQKSVSLDNPSGKLFKNENSYNNASIAERSLRNVQGEAINPNYSKTSFIKPYWEQMKNARINALNNVDFQILPNQSFNNYLNTSGDYNLGANEVSNTAGQSKFSLARKDFNSFINNPTVDTFREITHPENVDNINYLPYVANPYRALNEYAPSSKFRSMIRLRNNVADDNLGDTSVHELSHTSDWNGVLMPQSDVNLIDSYSKNTPDTEWNNYIKTPTETRARLNALRFQMKNQGIYNPFVEKATIKSFDSYKPLTDDTYDPLLQLRSIYTDEQILDMMNTISRKEPSKNSTVDNTQYAKDGGWINMYAEGDVVEGENPPKTLVATQPDLNALVAQYEMANKAVQAKLAEKQTYIDKVKTAAQQAIDQGIEVEKTGFVPQDITCDPRSLYCISAASYMLHQAGDDSYKYFSNSKSYNDALAGKNPRRYEPDEKYIEPTDLLQFRNTSKFGPEAGEPHHTALVLDVVDYPGMKGWKEVKVAMNRGTGPIVPNSYFLGPDNKIYYSAGDKTPVPTLLMKKNWDQTELNNLINTRNNYHQQILGIDPQYFTPKEDIRSGDYKQTGFLLNEGVKVEDQGTDQYGNSLAPTLTIPGVHENWVNKLVTGKPTTEVIRTDESYLTDILAKYNDPKYKYDYMRSHNISNDEYDAAVKNMIGIYGEESKFNTDYIAGVDKAPESPWLSKVANALGIINQEKRSIGPFQVTYNQLPEKYRKTIEAKDLYDPMTGAAATMENLTAGISLLRKRANTTAETATEDNPYSSNITKDNYLSYLPYLHNMRRWLKGDDYTQANFGDILQGNADYKKSVDQYANNVLQIIPTMLTTPQPLEVTPQQKNGGFVQAFKNGGCCNGMYNEGSWVTNQGISTPTTPSFYSAYPDRTLTNYQMGTDKAPMYNAGSTVWTKQNVSTVVGSNTPSSVTQNYRNTGSLNPNKYLIGDVIPTGMNYKTPAAGIHDYNQDEQPYHTMRLHAPDTTMMGDGSFVGKCPPGQIWSEELQTCTLQSVEIIGKRKNIPDSTNVRESTFVNVPNIKDPVVQNPFNQDFDVSYANKLLKEHNVKVDSTGNLLEDVGLPSSAYYNPVTRTINYNSNADNSLTAKRRYIKNVIEEIPHAIQADRMSAVPFLVNIGIDALSNPSYSRYRQKGTLENEAHYVIAPKLYDQLDEASWNYPLYKYGSYVKKHINSPRVYGNPINPSGMSEGPTSQRGIMFENGGWINKYEDAGVVGGNDEYEKAKARYITARNRGVMGQKEMQDLTIKFPQLANDQSVAGAVNDFNRTKNSAPLTIEQKVNKNLHYPEQKAIKAADDFEIDLYNQKINGISTDNFRHPMAARYTSEAIQNKFPSFLQVTGIPQIAGFLGANALGAGHEAITWYNQRLNDSERPLWENIRESAEDMYNNAFGAAVGSMPLSDDVKTNFLKKATINGYIPDGQHYGEFDINNYKDNSRQKRNGGLVNKYANGSTVGGGETLPIDPRTGMPVVNLKEVEVTANAPWHKYTEGYTNQYGTKEDFIDQEKKKYLKYGDPGLLKGLGVSYENFPEVVAQNYGDQYDYLKNNYIMEQYAKENNIDLGSRADWVNTLSPGYQQIIANSKYGTMLQPSAWDRGLSGLQQLGNTFLPGKPFDYRIKGLTTQELKEAKDSPLSGLDIFSPVSIIGRNTANYLSNRGLSTGSDYKELPGFFSGKNMPNVSESTAMVLDPFTYAGLEAIPESVYNLGKLAKNEVNLFRANGLKNYGLTKANNFKKAALIKGRNIAANMYNNSKIMFGLDLGPIGKDYAAGFVQGFNDILTTNRPFFETFPITKGQLRRANTAQNNMANQATEFVKDWYYPDRMIQGDNFVMVNSNPTLNKTAYNASQKVMHKAGLSSTPMWNDQLILGAQPILVNTRESKVAEDVAASLNLDINDPKVKEFVQMIKQERPTSGGFLAPKYPNNPISFRNRGLYYNNPNTFGFVTSHELAHTAEAADNSWDLLSIYNPSAYKYFTATDNPAGIEFKNAMVEPNDEYKLFREDLHNKGIFDINQPIDKAPSHLQQTLNELYDKSYLWQGYPGEVHANLMGARFRGYKDLIDNYGYSHAEAIKALKDPEDMTLDYLIHMGGLNQFFKPTTSEATKYKLIKSLHKDGGYVNKNNNTNAWLDQYN